MMRKLIIFGTGALIGAIGAVAVLSKLSAKDKSRNWACNDDCDCDDCDFADFKRTQHPVEMTSSDKAAVAKALGDMCDKIQQTVADITHIAHCAPSNTDKSVDWDDPCLKCTDKGSEHCDKGIKNCPFVDKTEADEAGVYSNS